MVAQGRVEQEWCDRKGRARWDGEKKTFVKAVSLSGKGIRGKNMKEDQIKA